MKIACFEITAADAARLSVDLAPHECRMTDIPLTAANAPEFKDAQAVSCFIYSDMKPAVLDALPALRLIATRSTGCDHIDLEHCTRRGITVCNVPEYGSHTVAEHVFALLLALARHIPAAAARTRSGDFSLGGLRGFDLHGKIMGIIGTGLIGREAARIARGFGMTVIACDSAPQQDIADSYGFSYVTFDELLRRADVISLHVPATAQTRHMLSGPEFAAMKHGVVIINTARGSIIDVKALYRALTEGKVAAAGLDVLPEEPAIREEAELLSPDFTARHNLETLLIDHALTRHKNVIVTPHSAFFTAEATGRILKVTAQNIQSFAGGAPINTYR